MKKLLTVLLALTASICSAFAFGACNISDLFGKTDNGGSDKEDSYYNVTVTGVDHLFYEQLKDKYKAGTEVEVKLNVITDVGLYVFVNDKRVTQSHYDSDYWGYKFTMPEEDIEVYITFDAYHGVELCNFDEVFYWVNYLKNGEVVKIKCETDFNNPNLGISPEINYITDKEEIENICAVFDSKLKPCAAPQIAGGSCVTYTFYTADAEYELLISSGYTVSISFSTSNWFKIVR